MNAKDSATSCSPRTFVLGMLHCAKDVARLLLNIGATVGAILVTGVLIDVVQTFYTSTFDLPPWNGFDVMQKAVADLGVAFYLCCLWVNGEFDVTGLTLKTSVIYVVSFLIATFIVVGLCAYALWADDIAGKFPGFGWQPGLTTGENLGLVPLKLIFVLSLTAFVGFFCWGAYSGSRQAIRVICDKGNSALKLRQSASAAE